jgi:hypothetical protein
MTSPRILALASLLVIVSLAAVFAPGDLATLVAVWVFEGGTALLWVAAATGIGLTLLSPWRTDVRGTLALATAAGLGLGAFGLGLLGLGLAGWLARPVVVGMMVLGLGLLVPQLTVANRKLQIENRKTKLENPLAAPLPPAIERWSIWPPVLVLAAMAGLALLAAANPPAFLWKSLGDPHPYDVLEYHLQVPREWYEAGRIVPLHHNVFSHFPFGVEMHFLAAMYLRGGPWAGMYTAQFLALAHMALAVLAVHGAVAQWSRGRFTPLLAAAAAAAVPWTVLLGSVAYNEAGIMLYAALAIGWTLGPGNARSWVLAGLLAGLGAGCKYTALPMLLVLWPLARLVARPRPRLAHLGLYVAAGCLAVSPWLIRNAVWTGNPVFPEAMSLLGRGHFSPAQVERWQAAHAAAPQQASLTGRTAAVWSQLLADGRYGWVLWPGLVAVWLARRTGLRSSSTAAGGTHAVQSGGTPAIQGTGALIAYLALLTLFWMGWTHLQSRFFTVAIIPAALLLAAGAAGADQGADQRTTGGVRGLAPARWAAMLVMILLAASTLRVTWQPLRNTCELGLFGLEELWRLIPDAEARVTSGQPVVLVGDAMAFLWGLPMQKLRYRTVFDVDQQPGQDLVTAWLGPDPPAHPDHPPADHEVIINPAELERLSRYKHLRYP